MEDILIDDSEDTLVEVPKKEVQDRKKVSKKVKEVDEDKLISCLRNEKVIVKFVNQERGLVSDPKHILYGGLGVNSKRKFVVPKYQNVNTFVNILTNSEKDYLEYIMGLEENAMSVYRKVDNFWSNRGVILSKENNILDLSNPDDYISYKILLANKDQICPSEEELRTNKKATYQFVITKEGEDVDNSIDSLNTLSKAYMLFGDMKKELDKLALVVEIATGKTISNATEKLIFANVNSLIKDRPDKFISAAADEYLDTKLLIKKAVNEGYIRKRGQYYYLTEGNIPLCNNKQEPTLQSACEYLNAPKYQEVKFTLEAKIKG